MALLAPIKMQNTSSTQKFPSGQSPTPFLVSVQLHSSCLFLNGIIQAVLFCVWLLWSCIISVSLIHMAVCIDSSFFKAAYCSIVWIYHISCILLVQRHGVMERGLLYNLIPSITTVTFHFLLTKEEAERAYQQENLWPLTSTSCFGRPLVMWHLMNFNIQVLPDTRHLPGQSSELQKAHILPLWP